MSLLDKALQEFSIEQILKSRVTAKSLKLIKKEKLKEIIKRDNCEVKMIKSKLLNI